MGQSPPLSTPVAPRGVRPLVHTNRQEAVGGLGPGPPCGRLWTSGQPPPDPAKCPPQRPPTPPRSWTRVWRERAVVHAHPRRPLGPRLSTLSTGLLLLLLLFIQPREEQRGVDEQEERRPITLDHVVPYGIPVVDQPVTACQEGDRWVRLESLRCVGPDLDVWDVERGPTPCASHPGRTLFHTSSRGPSIGRLCV